jgi:hypothetical protein
MWDLGCGGQTPRLKSRRRGLESVSQKGSNGFWRRESRATTGGTQQSHFGQVSKKSSTTDLVLLFGAK